jgi:hypothetical protein
VSSRRAAGVDDEATVGLSLHLERGQGGAKVWVAASACRLISLCSSSILLKDRDRRWCWAGTPKTVVPFAMAVPIRSLSLGALSLQFFLTTSRA